MLGIERVELSTASLEYLTSLPVFPLADAYPYMQSEALTELAQDIAKHGVLNAILVFDGHLLDGRNRLKAVVEANRSLDEEDKIKSLPFGNFEGSIEEAEDLVISLNERRRDLTPGQRAIIADKHRGIIEERAKERMIATQNNNAAKEVAALEKVPEQVQAGNTRDVLAEKHNVNSKYIDNIKRLRQAASETAESPDDPQARVSTPRAQQAQAGLRAIETGKERNVSAVVERVFKAKSNLHEPGEEPPITKALKQFTSAKVKIKDTITEVHKQDKSQERLEKILEDLEKLTDYVVGLGWEQSD